MWAMLLPPQVGKVGIGGGLRERVSLRPSACASVPMTIRTTTALVARGNERRPMTFHEESQETLEALRVLWPVPCKKGASLVYFRSARDRRHRTLHTGSFLYDLA